MIQTLKTKKGLMIAGGVVGMAVLLAGGWFAYSASRYKISAEEAQAIALKNAGVTDSEVTFSHVEKDNEDMAVTYEVSFNTNEGEYDYTIDAESGSIIDRDYEANGIAASSSVTNTTVANNNSSASTAASSAQAAAPATAVTEAQAKETALKDAGLAETAVVNLFVQLDVENGKNYYDVDFDDTNAGLDYSYMIDAETGAIVEKSKEPIND